MFSLVYLCVLFLQIIQRDKTRNVSDVYPPLTPTSEFSQSQIPVQTTY